MNSRNRNIANPRPAYKVRLADGTMASFPTFDAAQAVSFAITGPKAKPYRDAQPGYILIP